MEDIYKFAKQKLELYSKIDYTYEKSEPIAPLKQLIFIQPRQSLNLLPKKLEQAILKHNISKYYPKEFTILPYDNEKEYTWIPDIELLNEAEVLEFFD